MMILELRIAALSLSQQQRILRRLEHKRKTFVKVNRDAIDCPDDLIEKVEQEWQDLYRRRLKNRWRGRSLHIAYCFLRNLGLTPFKAIEEKSWTPPDWDVISDMVEDGIDPSLDSRLVMQRFAEWRDAAGEWQQPPPKPAQVRPSLWVLNPDTDTWEKPA